MRANLRSIAEAANADPVSTLMMKAGSMTNYVVAHNLVLVATYVRPPRKMKGPDGTEIEFHYTDKTLMEDRFQGKIGLVLKCGPMAFVDDGATKFGGFSVEPGDWVLYRPSDAMELFIKDHTGEKNDGIPVRLIEDVFIKARVSDPSLVY